MALRQREQEWALAAQEPLLVRKRAALAAREDRIREWERAFAAKQARQLVELYGSVAAAKEALAARPVPMAPSPAQMKQMVEEVECEGEMIASQFGLSIDEPNW